MERMNLTLDIRANEIGPKRVNLRSSLVVGSLIATVKDKYNLDGPLELRLPDSPGALPGESSLDQAGVTDGGSLICAPVLEASHTLDVIERGQRLVLGTTYKRVYLQEELKRIEFEIAWQPAIIGRKHQTDPSQNRLLAVDLDGVEATPTVSRHHACLTETGGSFFIESVNENNPTYLGNIRLAPASKYPLTAGDRIRVGRLTLTFGVVS
jgi:hypothetical protein